MLKVSHEITFSDLPYHSSSRDRTAESKAGRGCSVLVCSPLKEFCTGFIRSTRQTPIDRSIQHSAVHGRHQVIRQCVIAAAYADDELLLSSGVTSAPAVRAIQTALPYGPRV